MTLWPDAKLWRSTPYTLNLEPEEELDPRPPDPVLKPLLELWPVSEWRLEESKTLPPSPLTPPEEEEEEEVEDSEHIS